MAEKVINCYSNIFIKNDNQSNQSNSNNTDSGIR